MATISPSLPTDPGQEPKPRWSADLLKQIKELPEWLNAAQLVFGGIGSLTATVVATFALKDWPWAYSIVAVAGTVVVLGIVLLLAVKGWRTRSQQAGEQGMRAILLGIGPIEHAPLPRRGGDAQRVVDMVEGLDYRYGVLMGKIGAGKTSLVRAELLPRLKRDGYLPVHVPRPTGDIQAATREAIGELFPPDASLPDGDPRARLFQLPTEHRQRVILLYDQLDDLLLSEDESRRNEFVEWVRTCVKDPMLKVRFLFVLRSDVYNNMQDILPSTPGAWTIAHRHELNELSPDDARSLLKLVVGQHEARFKTRLIGEIVNDLSYRGRISPMLLQIVATSLKQRGIGSKRRYRAIGEAAAILEWHVVEQIQGAPDPRLAHDVLKRLVASGEWQSGFGESLASLQGAANGPDPAQTDALREARNASVCKLLARLTSARLVVRNVDHTYSVPHPIMHAAVVSAVAQVEAEEAPEVRKSVALLERYVEKYQARHRVCIPYGDLRTIRRYVPLRIRVEQPAQALLWKSLLVVRLIQATFVAMVSWAALIGGLVLARVVVPYDDWDDPIRIGMPVALQEQAPNPKVVGFLPSSRRLVLAQTDTTSNLGNLYTVGYGWEDLETVDGRLQATLKQVDTGAPLTALAFHPDGDGMVSGDVNGEVRIWDSNLQGGKIFLEPRLADEQGNPCARPGVSYLSYSKGGVRLVVSRCRSIEIWDTVQKSLLGARELPEDVPPEAIRANPSGDVVALIQASREIDKSDPNGLVTQTSRIFLWELKDGLLDDVYTTPAVVRSSGVLEIGFAQDGRLVVAAMSQMRLMRLTFDQGDSENPKPDVLGELKARPSETAMSNDGTVIAITDGRSTWWIRRDRPWWLWCFGAGAPEVLRPIQWSSSFMSSDGKALLLTGAPKHTLFKHDFRLFHLSRLWPFNTRTESIASLLGSPWR